MKLLSYIITIDSGLAPNPFSKYCTLALCIPNHKNALLNNGDWILGLSSKDNGNKLIYFMKLTEEPMQRNIYFKDKRFDYKRPFFSNDRNTLVGDNIYYLENGKYKMEGIKGFHSTETQNNQDTKYNKVFISDYFFYFGNKSFNLEDKFKEFIWKRQNYK